MNLVHGIAKLSIIAFYIMVLLLASNRHKKPIRGVVNFWVVLAVVSVNLATLVFSGLFDGFFNLVT